MTTETLEKIHQEIHDAEEHRDSHKGKIAMAAGIPLIAGAAVAIARNENARHTAMEMGHKINEMAKPAINVIKDKAMERMGKHQNGSLEEMIDIPEPLTEMPKGV